MHTSIRPDIWVKVGEDRLVSDGRVYQRGQAWLRGISAAGWLSHFCHSHHDCQIDWPDPAWNDAHEGPGMLTSVQAHIGSWPWGRIVARGKLEGISAAYVLRRLLSQHFGLRPAQPYRVTGGPHVKTYGELRRCPTCSEQGMQRVVDGSPIATPLPYPFAGSSENRDIPVMPWRRDPPR